jgi:hypothetical protein
VTKYSAAALVPLLVLYPLLRRKWRCALWVLLPVAVFGLWCLQSWLFQHKIHIVRLIEQRANQEQGFSRPLQEKSYAGLTVAGASLFLLPALIVAWMRKRAWLALPLLVAAGVAAYCGVNLHFGRSPWRCETDRVTLTDDRTFVGEIVEETDKHVRIHVVGRGDVRVGRHRIASVERGGSVLTWQYYLWAATGGALLVGLLVGGLASSVWMPLKREQGGADWFFLVAWVALASAFGVVFTPFQAMRHVLPALAPMACLALRLTMPPRTVVRNALVAMLVVQAAVAGLVAAADYEYADTYRKFAEHAADQYGSSSETVWFNGHWGWQHYALEAGFAHYVTEGEQPKTGDIILDPKWVHHTRYARELWGRLETVEEVEYPARVPARTMCRKHGYFYAVTQERAPYYFTFETTPLEVGRVFLVRAPEAKPPAKPPDAKPTDVPAKPPGKEPSEAPEKTPSPPPGENS